MNDVFDPPIEPNDQVGVVLVDHGSVRDESNAIVVELANRLRRQASLPIVEPAHMELAEPSLGAGFNACVEQGARHIVVVPFFLGPGRHVEEDIPRLAAEAASKHSHVSCTVAPPLGLHPLIVEIVRERALTCLSLGQANGVTCDDPEDSTDDA